MSIEENKKIVRRYIEEIINTGNVAEIEKYISADYVEIHESGKHAICTHMGTWLGIKPTGKKVIFTGVNINRIVDGKIVEHGGAANMMGPLLEIGALQVVGD